ncbi:MAG TPA: NAD-dependent epimerase/dehydratase family protein [Xanthomonadaceae bacterium]|nr:NAD-dependent epimerase/dehydratase family protein [Xanthomonadaceae bacterium]
MKTTRRDMLKLGALALGAGAVAHAGLLRGAHAAESVGRSDRPLRILILGGTGFTGPHQVRYALARGHKVTVFNRGRRPQAWPGEVEELTGDRLDGSLDALRDGEWDVCIDNPTTLPYWVRDAGKVLKDKVGQYIFISTLSVYASNALAGEDENGALAGYEGEDPLSETMESFRANPGALYGALKAASEREAERWFPGITTIIRPGLIVGPGDETDRFTYWPLRLARGGEVLAPSDGDDPVQIIDARDLAEWTIRMAEQRAFGAYNAMGPDYEMSIAAMLYGIRAVTGTASRIHWVPAEFLAEHNVRPWADMPTWVPAQGDSIGFSTRSNARAITHGLGFRPLATTVADTLAWFRSQPEERQAEVRAGIKPEREAEVLAAWKARSA